MLVARLRVRRQRTFSASRIRRTWLRPTWMPASRAVWARVSKRPLRRAVLPPGGQLPVRVALQPPRRHRAGHRDDGRPLRLGDPPLAPGAGPVPEPVDAGRVEPVQPAAHLLGMAAEPPRDRRHAQPVPAQRDDPGPFNPVRRGMAGPGQLADLPLLTVIMRRTRFENLRHRAHPQATGRRPAPPILKNPSKGERSISRHGQQPVNPQSGLPRNLRMRAQCRRPLAG